MAKQKSTLGRIETGIKHERRGRTSPFTKKLATMTVGSSFIITAQVISLFRSSASLYGKRNGKVFSILQEGRRYRCHRTS